MASWLQANIEANILASIYTETFEPLLDSQLVRIRGRRVYVDDSRAFSDALNRSIRPVLSFTN